MTKSIFVSHSSKQREIQPSIQIQQLSLFYYQKAAFNLLIPQNSITAIVEDLIVCLRPEYNYTIISVTHNLAQVKRIADYAGLFWVDGGSGRLIEFAPNNQFFTLLLTISLKLMLIESKGN